MIVDYLSDLVMFRTFEDICSNIRDLGFLIVIGLNLKCCNEYEIFQTVSLFNISLNSLYFKVAFIISPNNIESNNSYIPNKPPRLQDNLMALLNWIFLHFNIQSQSLFIFLLYLS